MIEIPADIDELEAGPELNALVAEKVMGWRYAASPVGGPKFWQDPDKDFEVGYLLLRSKQFLAGFDTFKSCLVTQFFFGEAQDTVLDMTEF